jgi:phosphoserine phosphatase
MDAVLTLVAAPDVHLESSTVDRVRDALSTLGADSGAVDWLAPARACDLPFQGVVPDQADAAARLALGGARVDVIAQNGADRKKRLLVADMESTIIHQEMLDELGEMVGLGGRIAEITRRAMNGEIDFKGALRERVGLLAGLPESALDEAYQRVEFMPGARALVQTMRASGARCVLVSGGFRAFTRRVAATAGFHEEYGNDLEIVDGTVSGRTLEPILDRESKAALLIQTATAHQIPIQAVLAVGDGANDLPMLMMAGLGVAFRAKPSVAAAARTRLDHADLTGLLYAQGYRLADILNPA